MNERAYLVDHHVTALGHMLPRALSFRQTKMSFRKGNRHVADTADRESERAAYEHYQLAWAAQREDCLDDALLCLDKAISMAASAQTRSVYLATRGGFLIRAGAYEKGIAACEEAVALIPKNFHAWSEMGLANLRLQRFVEAARCLERAANLRADHAVYTLLANAQLPFDAASALRNAERALELEPSWDEARRVRDSAERRLGESEEDAH